MKELRSKEEGHVIVEATIIFPIMILMVIALFYASIFLCQRANLQANLQNALMYFKNVQSDSFVGLPSKEMVYMVSSETKSGGTSFAKNNGEEIGLSYKIPYAEFFTNSTMSNEDAFKQFFRYMAGTMFFDDGSNVEVTYPKPKNYIVYKEISATAVQEVSTPLDFSMIGWDGKFRISASAEVSISDGNSMVRKIDFVADLISNSKLGDKLKNIADHIGNAYEKIKGVFKLDEN